MNLENLFTNAGINIGFATLFLSLFSVFSKQPGNAGVYYARDLQRESRNTVENKERRTLESFIPSVGWLVRAYRATEEDILKQSGLDAVVFLRIFIFSIRLFAFSSIVGLFILVPTTFGVTHDDGEQQWKEQSFSKFTISNLEKGSKRFWVHFALLYIESFVIYFMLYKEYSNISRKRLDFLLEQNGRPDQFSVLVQAVPKGKDGKSYSDNVHDFISHLHPDTYLSHQMVYSASKVVGMITRLENMKKEIDFLKRKPASERKPRRDGFCGLFGQKVDPVEKKVKQLEDLYRKIRQTQQDIINKDKEIPSAIVSFKSRWGASVAAQTQQAENPCEWITEWAPEPRDVYWSNLSVSSIQAWLRRIFAAGAVFLITIFYCVPSTFIVAINGIGDLQEKLHLPDFVVAILSLPGLEQIISGYLSTVLLAALLYLIPPTMLFISRLEGYPSKSSQERKASEKFFYFLAGPIFFIQVLGGGVVDIVSKELDFIKNPADIPFRLASLLPGQATFFMSYVMTTGWAGFPLEILNISTLLLNLLKRHTVNDDSGPELELTSLPYFRVIPNVLVFVFIGIIYSLIAPLLPPFLLVYFGLGYVVFKNQIIHVYEPAYETAGQYWPAVYTRIVAGLVILQITFIGIFEIKMSTTVSLCAAPLPIVTFIFYQYCHNCFYPIFQELSVETTRKKDKDDERRGLQNEIYDIISNAYIHPGLKPVDISGYGNPEVTTLLHSDSLP